MTRRNIQRVFFWDDFDNLSASQSESPRESEPLWRAIEYEAGKPFRNSFKIDDKTGTLFQDDPLDRRFSEGGNAGIDLSLVLIFVDSRR
jgi:hypothetical protein